MRCSDASTSRRVGSGTSWKTSRTVSTPPEWEEQLLPYFEEYATIGTGPSARGPALFQVTEEGEFWRVRQVLEDPEGDHGWALLAVVDIPESDAAGEIVFDELSVVEG